MIKVETKNSTYLFYPETSTFRMAGSFSFESYDSLHSGDRDTSPHGAVDWPAVELPVVGLNLFILADGGRYWLTSRVQSVEEVEEWETMTNLDRQAGR